jgi:hypothetical protein
MAAEMGATRRARVLEYFTLDQMALKNEACYYELLGTVIRLFFPAPWINLIRTCREIFLGPIF